MAEERPVAPGNIGNRVPGENLKTIAVKLGTGCLLNEPNGLGQICGDLCLGDGRRFAPWQPRFDDCRPPRRQGRHKRLRINDRLADDTSFPTRGLRLFQAEKNVDRSKKRGNGSAQAANKNQKNDADKDMAKSV